MVGVIAFEFSLERGGSLKHSCLCRYHRRSSPGRDAVIKRGSVLKHTSHITHLRMYVCKDGIVRSRAIISRRTNLADHCWRWCT